MKAINVLQVFVVLCWMNPALYAKNFNLNDALAAVKSAPDWTSPPEHDIEAINQDILDVLQPYLDLDVEDARSLVTSLMESTKEFDLKTHSKVLIFNRLYFAVPDVLEGGEVKSFGGWLGFPNSGEQINLLYPISVHEKSELRLTGIFLGFLGSAYRGKEEFDYFLQKFGKRTNEK